jgi:hypothetical protein
MMVADGFAFTVAPEARLIPAISTASSPSLNEAVLCSVSPDESAMLGPVDHAAGSGGFLDFVFRAAARELFGIIVPAGPLPFVKGRNADFEELVLEVRPCCVVPL